MLALTGMLVTGALVTCNMGFLSPIVWLLSVVFRVLVLVHV